MIALEDASIEDLKRELRKKQGLKKKSKPRFEITGTWSGYESRQRKIAYREYSFDKNFIKDIEELGCITFSDGTRLELNVREMEYGERKQKALVSYSNLILKSIRENKIKTL